MIDHKKIIKEWLNNDFVGKDLSKISIDQHVDDLLNIKNKKMNYSIFIDEGMKLFYALIDVCKENNLLNQFIPTFRISLADISVLEKKTIKTKEELIQNMSSRPPEICLLPRVACNNISPFEEYQYSDDKDYFQDINKEGIQVIYNIYRDSDDIEDDWDYSQTIYIQYCNKELGSSPKYIDTVK